MTADETRQSDEQVTLTPEERTALNRALRGDVREYRLEWVVYPAVERIVAERLADLRDELHQERLGRQQAADALMHVLNPDNLPPTGDLLIDLAAWARRLLDQRNEALGVTPDCPCGCPPEVHVGEIGCPCGLPDEPPCTPESDRRIRPGGDSNV